jgi:predicted phage baseplate assembly protein
MPLPLPNLDTRAWADLVEEGRALVPIEAPDWSDLNYSDPGVTQVELLAWLIEQDVYRVNRVPERHRRKFLALLGYDPQPPQPARTVLSFALVPGTPPLVLPRRVTVAPTGPSSRLRFRTVAPLSVTDARLEAVLTFDGHALVDQTARWREGLPVQPWGANPDPADGPAYYLGFDPPPPPGVPVTLWVGFAGRSGEDERGRIEEEARAQALFCAPQQPPLECEDDDPKPPAEDPGEQAGLVHHAVRTVWEMRDVAGWRGLDPDAGEVVDRTRGLTLGGAVQLRLPAAVTPTTLAGKELAYVRCRLESGRPDDAPVLVAAAANAVLAEQAFAVRRELRLARGVAAPPPGTTGPLQLAFDDEDTITAIAPAPGLDVPDVTVLETSADSVTPTFVIVGRGDGLPGRRLVLPEAPVAGGGLELWSVSPAGELRWQQRRDLDASGRHDLHYTLEPTTGVVRFGDGQHGRVLPADAVVLAAFAQTAGEIANLATGLEWRLAGADDALNRLLLGADPSAIESSLTRIANPVVIWGGHNEETVDRAAGRAAAVLWSHERLVELCPATSCTTLDQLAREEVLERQAPPRATTVLDFERLALDVPGCHVLRARAWPAFDPRHECLSAPGTVTVVIVPGLPQGRPVPTRELVGAVWRYLNRRRVLCTRLLVVGPEYVEVSVSANVRARPGADLVRVRSDVERALHTFLDPLVGGPAGYGWPFGRHVYRAEILQLVDGVEGVDYVLSLELRGAEGERCDNICVPPTSLVASGVHCVEVEP